MYDKWQCGYVTLKPLLWQEIIILIVWNDLKTYYHFPFLSWFSNLTKLFHYMLLLVPSLNIQYAFGNAGCFKYQMGTRLLLIVELVFEKDDLIGR
jgi:hypothetical protein